MNSLTARLLAASLLVVFLFATLTGVALERAAVADARLAERDRLRGLVYGLLGAAEFDAETGLYVPDVVLPEAELRQPGSGTEASLWRNAEAPAWQSPSVVAAPAVPPSFPAVGEFDFGRLADTRGGEAFRYSFGLRWLREDGEPEDYTLVVSKDVAAFDARRSAFRYTLWSWLAAFTLVLLLLQWSVLRWGLTPLRRLHAELSEIRAGRAEGVKGSYPRELQPLGDSFNALLEHERGQQTRHRNALADLAHSLKTPLAVLRGLPASAADAGAEARLHEQVERMDQIVAYQLRRAAAAGSRIWHGHLALLPQLQRIVGAMEKVYRDRGIRFELAVAQDFSLPLEQGDLMEIFGNLLDNASKHCRSRVRVTARAGDELSVDVEDDGRGFGDGDPRLLLQRGVRQDSRHEGQGFGLALVADIVDAAGGRIHLDRSEWGGARVRISLPT